MRLRDYPRPAGDTGIGMHWGTGDTSSADVNVTCHSYATWASNG